MPRANSLRNALPTGTNQICTFLAVLVLAAAYHTLAHSREMEKHTKDETAVQHASGSIARTAAEREEPAAAFTLMSCGAPKYPQTTYVPNSTANSHPDVILTVTTPDSGNATDLIVQDLHQSRTTDEKGETRQGLVVPPTLTRGRFLYEDHFLVEESRPQYPWPPLKAGLYHGGLPPMPRTPKLRAQPDSHFETPDAISVGESLTFKHVEVDYDDDELDELCLNLV